VDEPARICFPKIDFFLFRVCGVALCFPALFGAGPGAV